MLQVTCYMLMKLIVGLGNPGNEYAKTRHNAGFLVIDELANRLAISFSTKKALKGEVAEAAHEHVVLLKPGTFMNLSGEAVKAATTKYRVEPKDVLVVLDDADIAFAELRFRTSGSAAGHNGMKSILEQFPADTAIARLKVGIGRSSNPEMPLDAWVLAKWTKEEAAALPDIVSKAADRARMSLPRWKRRHWTMSPIRSAARFGRLQIRPARIAGRLRRVCAARGG